MKRSRYDIGLAKIRLVARKMSRATGEVWVILREDEHFVVMPQSEFVLLAEDIKGKVVECVTRFVKE